MSSFRGPAADGSWPELHEPDLPHIVSSIRWFCLGPVSYLLYERVLFNPCIGVHTFLSSRFLFPFASFSFSASASPIGRLGRPQ